MKLSKAEYKYITPPRIMRQKSNIMVNQSQNYTNKLCKLN